MNKEKLLIYNLKIALENELCRYAEIEYYKVKFSGLITGKESYLLDIVYWRYKCYGFKKTSKSYKHRLHIEFDADDIDLESGLIREFEKFNYFAELRDKLKDNNAENRMIKNKLKIANEMSEIEEWKTIKIRN